MAAEERIRRVRDVFDDWADRGRADGMEASHGFAARHAFDHLALGPGKRYLDVGCGNGYTVRWAAPVVGPEGRAVGLDVSERMIERAKALSPASCEFHVGAFPDHPFAAASFDAVFSMEVLYYLPDLADALRALHDLVVPGGRVASIVDYYGENEASHTWPEDLGCAMTLLPMKGWREAFEDAGLEVLHQGQLRYPPQEDGPPTWKQTHGSLVTLARRPVRSQDRN